MKKTNTKGFTLIEMVITIVIIVVLSSISVPIYKDYVRDAKLGEGHVLLSRIRDAQLRYYDEYGNFFSSGVNEQPGVFTANDPVMKIDARTNKYFSYFSSGNNNPANGFRGVARSPEFGYMYIVYTTTGYRHEGRAGAFWQVGATEYDIM